jgi:FkbM family methyltransferase
MDSKQREDLKAFINVVNESKINPTNVLEIGSRDGHHAEALREAFNIDKTKVYIVEPNPKQHIRIKKEYPNATLFGVAISNTEGMLPFHQIDSGNDGWDGISGLMDRPDIYSLVKTNTIEVPVFKGSTLLNQIGEDIDLCKIDVEGLTYEVLESFGGTINRIKVLQVETEEVVIWKNQRVDSEVSEYLTNQGFVKMTESFVNTKWGKQFDQVWLNKNFA